MKDFLVAVQGFSYFESRTSAGPILSRYGIDEPQWEATWKGLWTRFAYKTRQLDGQEGDVPFEILANADISGGVLKLVSGLCGGTTLQELRTAIGRENRSLEEWLRIAEDLALKNGGLVPNCAWLIENDFSGLDHAMRAHSELFAHLTQEDKRGNTPEEWLRIAEDLALKKGGLVPNCAWLRKNDCTGLDAAMRAHSELFAHLTQEENKNRTAEEWLPIAEDLALKNGGLVPTRRWLTMNKFRGLDHAMQKHSEVFTHLTQEDKRGKTAEEWLPIAEDLALKNGGRLPSHNWLKANKFSGLSLTISKHPKLFAHITDAA